MGFTMPLLKRSSQKVAVAILNIHQQLILSLPSVEGLLIAHFAQRLIPQLLSHLDVFLMARMTQMKWSKGTSLWHWYTGLLTQQCPMQMLWKPHDEPTALMLDMSLSQFQVLPMYPQRLSF